MHGAMTKGAHESRPGDAEVRALLPFARSEFPDVALLDDDVVAHVLDRTGGLVPSPEIASQLFLALGCVRGDAAALRAFELRYAPLLLRMARRAKLGDADANEVVQKLRVFLLVGDGDAPPKLADYVGRGDLQGWLRVVALRAAIRFARGVSGAAARDDDDAVLEVKSAGDDPEMSYLKAVYRTAFREAFSAAIGGLEADTKTILRQHFVDGLTIDELAPMYGVHRATAARRINEARALLLTNVRREFTTRARVSDREMNSVLRLVESRLGVTLSRLLA